MVSETESSEILKSFKIFTREQQKLMEETLYLIGEKLNLLKKVRVKDIVNYEVRDLCYSFYVDGEKDNYLYRCWFDYDQKDKQVVFYGFPHEKHQSIIPVRMKFPKKVVNDFGEKEGCGMWISKELFKHFGKEEHLENFFNTFLGYTTDYTKYFTVVRQSDGKPYTGKEGEKPFVVYHNRYMNTMNGSKYFDFHLQQLMKVVNKKCSELGFTLEGKGGLVKFNTN